MKGIAAMLFAASIIACHSRAKAPTPLPAIAMPSGAALKPWDPSKQPSASPNATVQLNGLVWVALQNLYSFDPAGPGMLVGVDPSAGVKTVIDLGGADEHQCQNPGGLVASSGKLYVSCGPFFTSSGAGVSEVDPVAGKVTRFVAAPPGFVPNAIAVTGSKIWLGDALGGNVLSIDRATFTADSPASLGCTDSKAYVPAMLVVGNDLYTFCSAKNGTLVRLDAGTGKQKGDQVLVGVSPIAIALTGDNRLAVVNTIGLTLTLVTPTATGMTVAKDVLKFQGSSDLEDLKALDQFLYVMSQGTQNLIKVDLSGAAPRIVDAVNTNPAGMQGATPNRVEVLDDNTAVVADFGLNELIGLQFGIKKAQ